MPIIDAGAGRRRRPRTEDTRLASRGRVGMSDTIER